ncbi:MAG: VWA domain-containing protein [Actinomycetota bacterium]|nr:VWA domain-containing protein [Actinomycetota bacterium]
MAEGLLDRTVSFVGALRQAGLPVSLAESLDAVRAMNTVDLLDREGLRAAFAATTVKRPAHRLAFDTIFDLWWPRAIGDGTTASAYGEGGEPVEGADGPLDPRDRDALRDALMKLLLDGDEEGLRRLARESVLSLGQADAQPGRQSWFSYRVLRQLSPETLMASLLEAMLGELERGGLAERVARETIKERMRQFEEMVEGEVRRRLAEERGHEKVARTAVKPLTDQVDFLRASRDDLVELRRRVFPLARRLATRLTARRRLGRNGRLDFRRTVRASLGTGGVPLVTHHRPHKPHKPELVVLCDVSGSVSSFAHFTLMLAYALREQFTKVRAFAFIDTTDEVTDFFRPSMESAGGFPDVMSRMAAEADLVWFDGHSDYGHAFEVFAEHYPDAVGPRTSLLVLGDARNNYRSTGAATLRQLCRQARHSYWLNPEPASYWGSGDSATAAYAELVDEMVECRNVAQLEEFVQRLLPV